MLKCQYLGGRNDVAMREDDNLRIFIGTRLGVLPADLDGVLQDISRTWNVD
jgi:hypothetical protein